MRPLASLSWMDLRAKEEAGLLSKRLGRSISPAWFAPKALWLKLKRPGTYERSRWFLQAMDFASLRLTGEVFAGIASPDIMPWGDEEIEAAGLDRSRFPELRRMGEPIGAVTREASRATGLPEGTPVFSGAPDFVEAILGTASLEKGLVCDKGGTSQGVELCWDREIRDPRFYSAPHPAAPGLWHIGAAIAATGKSLEWLGALLKTAPEEMVRLAEHSPPGSRGLIFLPHLAEERSALFQAPGGFLFISLDHQREDLVRAVLEGCALAARRVISAMRELGAQPREIRATGGQTKSRLWSQIKADIAGLEVVTTEAVHGEVLGAAMIAAFGAGFFPDLRMASLGMARPKERFFPRKELEGIYSDLYRAHNALCQDLEGRR
jgi:xylulokinase